MFSGPSRRLHARLLRLPIRVRVATSVAAVVFLILLVFAVVVGQIDAHRQRSAFYTTVYNNAEQFGHELHIAVNPATGSATVSPSIATFNGGVGAEALVTGLDGRVIAPTQNPPDLGDPLATAAAQNGVSWSATNYAGYRVVTIPVSFSFGEGGGYLQYAQPLSTVNSEIYGLDLMLFLGALIGTILAFGAGSLVARRAMAPIAQLTAAAGEIERTGDPSRTLPTPVAEDEVAELSRTLTGMLHSLTQARNQTEAMLERQRDFVADASHELRTPLTSVLANLELLVDTLRGPDREAAESALRSTQRMRRLVGDLLILARADSAGHVSVREQLDLADVVVEAASELEPASGDHTIELDVQPSPLVGSRDDLQRVATNLIENALRHTPPGTRVTASTRTLPDWSAELVVADDGPGIDPEARSTLFERFVRGAGDRGGSFGLGLAIVAAVTQAHGGTVTIDESPHGGARFTVRLPAAALADATPPPEAEASQPPVEPVES
jgi:two-component system, OmpR family, sensor kinase